MEGTRVSVSAKGYASALDADVLITVNCVTSLTGSETETVGYRRADYFQMESSEIGGTITDNQMTDLPLAIRTGVGSLRSPERLRFWCRA